DRGPEVFPKRQGTRFFEILAATYQTTERPFSFEETVSMSSVIGRGYFADVIPGRAISHKRRPGLPPIETVLLKITASSVLKGDYRQFYYVEYPSANTMIDELRQGLYAGEILFLL